MNARIRILSPGTPVLREVTGDTIRLGRNPDSEIAFDPAIHAKVSGDHARIEPAVNGFALVHLSRSNKTLLNDQPVETSAPVKVGDRIRLGFTGPILLVELLDDPAPDFSSTVQADEHHFALLRGTAAANRFTVGDGGVIGRDSTAAKFVLDHPLVSRAHAKIGSIGERLVIADLKSANGTFVNGVRIKKTVELKEGDRLDIGPFSLKFNGRALISSSRDNNVELVARNVCRVVKNATTGKKLTLLDNINLVIKPKEFVCLLGPSGSGKSTLLTILCGRAAPDAGSVTINGANLHANFAQLKQGIAMVPQKDALHDSLSVEQAMTYTAELRLPADTGRSERRTTVSDLLSVVGLTSRSGTRIRSLSGGQLKRASLANELLSRPSLLFLDEVTSGLDEQTDQEMMELFRMVADGGKTVVCITHNLSNVEAFCHLVVILTAGGKLAFMGTPDEAKSYFRVARLGEVYKKLGARPAEEWEEEFAKSSYYNGYIRDRMPEEVEADDEPAPTREAPKRKLELTKVYKQASVLTRRYKSIWWGNSSALLALFGQCMLVALLLGMAFGSLPDISNPMERAAKSSTLVFLLAVSSFWFGCNTAAKEIVKERTLYVRERAINLDDLSYLFSKLGILGVIGGVQITLLYAIVKFWCDPSGSVFLQWITLIALMFAGTTLGLLISAFASSEEVATALVPIVVIPQIVLSGAIVSLSGLSDILSRFGIASHWGYRALSELALNDKYPAKALVFLVLHSLIQYGATYAFLRFGDKWLKRG